ncbi:MAG: ribonuclease HIII [Candidatus Aenigmarchaeota archaeon]|nr:ribonuclease HIII [Candidatus Aenigmarchaeota archaeon]
MMKIGVDEAGKGDYFGYLVIAGVVVDDKKEPVLKKMGVMDSKRLSDMRVKEIAKQIKKTCQYEIIKISPSKYNTLHAKMKNLNKMLAWGHAKVISNLSEKNTCDIAISDKFADEKFLKEALKKLNVKIKVLQKINGEYNTAVAAASILARDEFLKTLRSLGRMVGMILPKGAADVEKAAKELVKRYKPEILNEVAKVHFKTTRKIIGQ